MLSAALIVSVVRRTVSSVASAEASARESRSRRPQGVTIERPFVLGSGRRLPEWGYVALSRAETRLYVTGEPRAALDRRLRRNAALAKRNHRGDAALVALVLDAVWS
jgi:hypothetical protein